MSLRNQYINLNVRKNKTISNVQSLYENKKDKEQIKGWIGIKVPQDVCDILRKIDVIGKHDKTYHITVIYVGEQTPEDFARTTQVLYDFLDDVKPFSIKTNKVISFNKNDDDEIPVVCKIESSELMKLQKKLCDLLDKEKIQYSKKWPEYKPHICLSYAKETVKDFKIPKIEFECDSFELWYGYNGSEIETSINITENYKSQLLHKTIISYLFNEEANSLNFIGTKKQIDILKNVSQATKKFIVELNDNNVSINSLMETLKLKHEAALEFKQVFGIDWLF
jgi:2'-5' RNA ligase